MYDPLRPHQVHLLGMALALYHDPVKGQWSCLEDRCSHRLAPLSEGRIEADGTLQCAYHGWSFSGRGTCTSIPQLKGDEAAHATACASRKSCVRAFPVQVVHDLIWVYPDSSEAGWAAAAANPLPSNAIPELLGGPESEGVRQCTKWFCRDMPLRFDTTLENVLDPSHVPFAHHGVQGSRKREKGTETPLLSPVTMQGFKAKVDFKGPFNTNMEWLPPTLARYDGSFRNLIVYNVPTKPGWSRLLATFLQDSKAPSSVPWLVNTILGAVESTTWLEHILQRNAVLDGDTYMLHLQERMLLAEGDNWRRSYFMPAAADSSVVATRRWLEEFGGAVPTCEPGVVMPAAVTKREALDRWSQHTSSCKYCLGALANVDRASVAALVAAAAAVLWVAAKAAAGQALLQASNALPLGAAAAAVLLFAWLRKFRESFFFVDYVHADKH